MCLSVWQVTCAWCFLCCRPHQADSFGTRVAIFDLLSIDISNIAICSARYGQVRLLDTELTVVDSNTRKSVPQAVRIFYTLGQGCLSSFTERSHRLLEATQGFCGSSCAFRLFFARTSSLGRTPRD